MRRNPPVVRELSWRLVIPQLVALVIAIGAFGLVLGFGSAALLWGAGSYVVYSWSSRALLARHHRSGIAALRRGAYAEALQHFQSSYDFFTEHAWLDEYRAFTMMSPSAASYREIALLNVAFCHVHLGNGAEARAAYQRVAEEFPDSPVAEAALRLIDSVIGERADQSTDDSST
jgi:tetratricopeptide (TPR) repeat protein